MNFFYIFFLLLIMADINLSGQDYSLGFDGDGEVGKATRIKIDRHCEIQHTVSEKIASCW